MPRQKPVKFIVHDVDFAKPLDAAVKEAFDNRKVTPFARDQASQAIRQTHQILAKHCAPGEKPKMDKSVSMVRWPPSGRYHTVLVTKYKCSSGKGVLAFQDEGATPRGDDNPD